MSIETLKLFHFMRPYYLMLLAPFIMLIYLNWRRNHKKQPWIKALPDHLLKALTVGGSNWSKQLPMTLLIILCVLVVVIIAGPTWQKQPSPFGEDSSDLIIVLDVSDSMLERDVVPSRLAMAKYKIQDLLKARNGGKTGLVVYSGSAHIAMPLTKDVKVFKPLLDSITPKVMPRQGKYAQYTLPVINGMINSATHSTILLVTDAISQKATEAFSHYFNQQPHQLIILGVGDDQQTSASHYDIQSLKNLASTTDGKLTTITIDDHDIRWIDRHIQQNLLINPENTMPWFDSGYYLVFLAAAISLLWFRKGWLVKWCLVASISSTLFVSPTVEAKEWQFIDLWLTSDQQGQYLFNQGKFKQAATTFNSSTWKASSYYLAGDYKLAHQYYLRQDTLNARFGAAAALAQQREYVAARKLYHDILEQDPNYPNAMHNYQLLDRVIKYIDQLSKSQNNSGEQQTSQELGDQPKTAEGAEVDVQQTQIKQQKLSSDDILEDPKASEKWMRSVQGKLDRYLSAKFYFQLDDGLATQEYQGNE